MPTAHHVANPTMPAPEELAYLGTLAGTLVESCRLVALTTLPPDALASMTPADLMGTAVQAALTVLLQTQQARQIPNISALAFVTGVGLGAALKACEVVDLSAVSLAIGAGISQALEAETGAKGLAS